jgi:hypothetical protein
MIYLLQEINKKYISNEKKFFFFQNKKILKIYFIIIKS